MGRLIVTDRRVALIFGVLGVGLGAWLLTQAYDARGQRRPLLIRLLPSLG